MMSRPGFHDTYIDNDIEAHPITSQTDEFQFVEASQTFGYTWLCSAGEDRHKQPKGGYDLFLRFTSEEFRTPEMENDFYAFRSAGFNIPLMFLAVIYTPNLVTCTYITYT